MGGICDDTTGPDWPTCFPCALYSCILQCCMTARVIHQDSELRSICRSFARYNALPPTLCSIPASTDITMIPALNMVGSRPSILTSAHWVDHAADLSQKFVLVCTTEMPNISLEPVEIASTCVPSRRVKFVD